MSTIIGLISLGYMIYSILQNVESPLAIEKIKIIHQSVRYSIAYSPPLITRILNTFIYFGSLLGGVHFIFSNTTKLRIVSFLPFIAAIGFTAALTTKTALLYPMVLFTSSAITSLIYRKKFDASITYFKKIILVFVISIIVIAPLADFLRGVSGSGGFIDLWEKLKPSIFGHISVFTDWFDNNWRSALSPTYGTYTIAGVFDILNISPRQTGLYTETIMIGKYGSNVYTIYRGLIQDFTLPGTMVLALFGGFVFELVFKSLINGRQIMILFLSGFYAFILWGFVVSIFNYNSIILAFFMFAVYLSGVNTMNIKRLKKATLP